MRFGKIAFRKPAILKNGFGNSPSNYGIRVVGKGSWKVTYEVGKFKLNLERLNEVGKLLLNLERSIELEKLN